MRPKLPFDETMVKRKRVTYKKFDFSLIMHTVKLCASKYSIERSQGQCKNWSRSGKRDLTNSHSLVGQHPVKSLSSICLSVRLSVHPSLTFFKIGSLIFSDIAHQDSWQWYLVKFLKTKPSGPKIGRTNQIRSKMIFFGSFSSKDRYFRLTLHTLIACNNV